MSPPPRPPNGELALPDSTQALDAGRPPPDPRFAQLGFHPACARWFADNVGQPTDLQWQAWAADEGQDMVLEAPTGTGKTLAAFFRPLDAMVRQALQGGLQPGVQVLYVSPLRALSADIAANLLRPLQGIEDLLRQAGLAGEGGLGVRVQLRTSDTSASERAAMRRRPPHILVTTPESLYLLLTSASGRRALAGVRRVVVDEAHALAGVKRGAHLALSLERLTEVCGRRPPRMALSATQNPIEEIAAFIAGARRPGQALLVRAPSARRTMDLALEIPLEKLDTLLSGEDWQQIHRRLLQLVREHRTTLVFVNNRRLCERLARALQLLAEEDGDGAEIAAHHGSLSKETRQAVEEGLRAGRYRAVVATASLELGIDIGAVDLVCQIGSPHGVGAAVQRFGRSGRGFGAVPKGRLFPISAADLAECAALLRLAREGRLDRLRPCRLPLDVLSQQIVAEVSCAPRSLDDLYALCRRAWPYRDLARQDFDAVAGMLLENFGDARGRRGALVHAGRAPGSLEARSHAGTLAMLNVGCIPDQFDFDVVLDPQGVKIGTVHEDFALEAMLGDVFQLGNHSYRLARFDRDKLRVVDAEGAWPNLPFWRGEAPGRSDVLSDGVDELRRAFAHVWEQGGGGTPEDRLRATAAAIAQDWGMDAKAAQLLCDHLGAGMEALGAMPLRDQLVLERFFDEAGEAHLVLHAPLGTRLLRAWGLALRKKFCRRFNFELQATALNEGFLLSLSATHAFPLEEVVGYLNAAGVGQVLEQAVLDAPVFPTHWRWNAATALALQRRRTSGRTPPPIQRAQAEDLLAQVFPDQLACLENIAGERQVPDHPLVRQTLHDCNRELMDLEGLEEMLRQIEAGQVRVVGVDTPAPSAFAQSLVAALPYAYLDGGELEDRRTRAVAAPPPELPAAGPIPADLVESVRAMVRPNLRGPADVAEALDWLVALTESQAREWQLPPEWLDKGVEAGLLAILALPSPGGGGERAWVRAERRDQIARLWEEGSLAATQSAGVSGDDLGAGASAGQGGAGAVQGASVAEGKADDGLLQEMLRSWLEVAVVASADELAERSLLPPARVAAALAAMQQAGYALPGVDAEGYAPVRAWCPKHLFRRLQRMRLQRRRQGQRPVPLQAWQRFLVRWHGLAEAGASVPPGGPDGLQGALRQLHGFAAQAGAWEADILPGRVGHYRAQGLDQLGLGGQLHWLRRLPAPSPGAETPGRGQRGKGAANPDIVSYIGASSKSAASPSAISYMGAPASLRASSQVFPVLEGLGPQSWAPAPPDESGLSGRARRLLGWCRAAGPCFAQQILQGSGLLAEEAEAAMRELAGAGILRCDSFAGVRALAGLAGAAPLERVPGRWYLAATAQSQLPLPDSIARSPAQTQPQFPPPDSITRGPAQTQSRHPPPNGNTRDPTSTQPPLPGGGPVQDWGEDDVRDLVRAWMRRWGLFFHALFLREMGTARGQLPPWRRVLRCLRLMEESEEILCGRFVDGVYGEQFALPQAATALRQGAEAPCGLTLVSACDPLNLTGYLADYGGGGQRVPAQAGNRLLLRDGQPLAAYQGGEFVALQPGWQADPRHCALLAAANPYGDAGPGPSRAQVPGARRRRRPSPRRPQRQQEDARRRAARITGHIAAPDLRPGGGQGEGPDGKPGEGPGRGPRG